MGVRTHAPDLLYENPVLVSQLSQVTASDTGNLCTFVHLTAVAIIELLVREGFQKKGGESMVFCHTPLFSSKDA